MWGLEWPSAKQSSAARHSTSPDELTLTYMILCSHTVRVHVRVSGTAANASPSPPADGAEATPSPAPPTAAPGTATASSLPQPIRLLSADEHRPHPLRLHPPLPQPLGTPQLQLTAGSPQWDQLCQPPPHTEQASVPLPHCRRTPSLLHLHGH